MSREGFNAKSLVVDNGDYLASSFFFLNYQWFESNAINLSFERGDMPACVLCPNDASDYTDCSEPLDTVTETQSVQKAEYIVLVWDWPPHIILPKRGVLPSFKLGYE